MANSTPSRVGQINGSGSVDAIFLKVFAGEVLAAFNEKNVIMERTMVRNIKNGKSAQFPATWKATAAYHTPGTEILGQSILSNERVITIDDILYSDVFIADIDEAKSHFEFRSEYSHQLGEALARTLDKNVFQVGILAARAAATITGANGGSVVTSSTTKTVADDLVTAIVSAAQALDEKDVPDSDRYVYLLPAQYYLLAGSSNRAINRDLNPEGNGSIASGKVLRIAGIPLVMTNHLPSTNVTTGVAAYQGNFSTTAALVMQRQAVGTVKLMDLSLRADYDPRRLGTLIVGKYAVGHGILRPECAVEIKTA